MEHPDPLNEAQTGVLVDTLGNTYELTRAENYGVYVGFRKAGEAASRNIGVVSLRSNVYCKREDLTNVYRKLNAWTISKMILVRVARVRYVTKHEAYEIDADKALKEGTLVTFGNEEKIAVPLPLWNHFKQ